LLFWGVELVKPAVVSDWGRKGGRKGKELGEKKGGEKKHTKFHRPNPSPGADVEDVLRVADGREVQFSEEGEEEEVVLEVCGWHC
jgi:hypothetical protein